VGCVCYYAAQYRSTNTISRWTLAHHVLDVYDKTPIQNYVPVGAFQCWDVLECFNGNNGYTHYCLLPWARMRTMRTIFCSTQQYIYTLKYIILYFKYLLNTRNTPKICCSKKIIHHKIKQNCKHYIFHDVTPKMNERDLWDQSRNQECSSRHKHVQQRPWVKCELRVSKIWVSYM